MTFGEKMDAVRADLRMLVKEFNENEGERAAKHVQDALASLRKVDSHEADAPDDWWDWEWEEKKS